MPQKKHSLELDIIDESPDFELFGIVSNRKLVSMAWHLNQCLKVDFERQESLIMDSTKKATRSEHPYLSYTDEENWLVYEFFLNKSIGGRLLPELPNIDYLLKIEDQNEMIDRNKIVESIELIDSVNFVFSIETEKLKNLENIIIK